jgi:ABC-type nitrate/sulfonate/bicarbonate transport system substrate-binding protein
MNVIKIISLMVLATLLLSVSGCITAPQTQNQATVVLIHSQGTGPMPTMLATKQVDGYIAWQPFVEVAPMAGIGKVVSYTQDLPPSGKWVNHPCCVLTARDDMIDQNPDIVNAVSALTILSTQYINENQDETAEIVADWLAGKGNFTYGSISVSSVDVLDRAVPTVKFTNEPTDAWKLGNIEFVHALQDLNTTTGSLSRTGDYSDAKAQELLFNTDPYQDAMQMIANGTITTPPASQRQLGIGYLMSDHHAALFVAVKNWQHFNDTYGVALKPKDPSQTRPEFVELIVNNQKIADVRLIPGSAGPQLMQLAGTDAVQMAYVGNPPAIGAVDSGTPIKILMAVNTEGSGVVVTTDSPANDWTSFVQWAEDRSQAGNPVKIATPGKGSIQDVLIRSALKESGLSVRES